MNVYDDFTYYVFNTLHMYDLFHTPFILPHFVFYWHMSKLTVMRSLFDSSDYFTSGYTFIWV